MSAQPAPHSYNEQTVCTATAVGSCYGEGSDRPSTLIGREKTNTLRPHTHSCLSGQLIERLLFVWMYE